MARLLFALLLLISINTVAQDRIAVGISSSGMIIETYEKKNYYLGGEQSSSSEVQLKDAYRLGPSAVKTLREGVRTAIKWAALNEEHQKDFEKEIGRFIVISKSDYEFHGYVPQLASEMIIRFIGSDDGSFKLVIEPFNSLFQTFITAESRDMLVRLRDLLDGKSTNREIDDIFKN